VHQSWGFGWQQDAGIWRILFRCLERGFRKPGDPHVCRTPFRPQTESRSREPGNLTQRRKARKGKLHFFAPLRLCVRLLRSYRSFTAQPFFDDTVNESHRPVCNCNTNFGAPWGEAPAEPFLDPAPTIQAAQQELRPPGKRSRKTNQPPETGISMDSPSSTAMVSYNMRGPFGFRVDGDSLAVLRLS
jgi:hypothetical protein